MRIWDVNVDNIFISILTKTKINSKYLIGYLDKVIRLLVSIMPKMSRYVKRFKVKDRDKNKMEILWFEDGYKVMSFFIDDEKLLEKHIVIWNKNEDLKNIEFVALSVYDDRYLKNQNQNIQQQSLYELLRFMSARRWLRMKSFTVVFIDFLLVYQNKHYLQ